MKKMNKFHLTDGLIKLKEKNYDNKINETIDILLNNFEEHQLLVLSSRGIKIDNNLINLFFFEGVGFRCYNDKDYIFGKLPICKNIEYFMNNLYINSFDKFDEINHN